MLKASSVSSNPSLPRVGRLDTLTRVRLEMTKLYKEARHGKLETQEATRLVFILQNIARLIEGGDFEKRLDDMENRLVTPEHHDAGSTTATH
jgi:hypothetical protein